MMKAMTADAFRNSDVFEQAETKAPPVIKRDHVLVKVAATSANTVDMKIRQINKNLPQSPTLPVMLGMDFAGTIETVGRGVTGYKVGDEVYGCASGLANLEDTTEYMLADSKLIAHKPRSVSMRQAAALPLVGITAYESLVRAGIAESQEVLVHGGSGGMSHVAVELANLLCRGLFDGWR